VATMSVLRVQRALDSAGVLRRIVVEVDGKAAARVGHDKTVEIAVAPGEHSVRAKMDWHGSRTIQVDVPAGETVSVRVSYSFASIRKLFSRTDSAIEIQALSR
jgi:hypothetical protein